jgi:hypothetical protein
MIKFNLRPQHLRCNLNHSATTTYYWRKKLMLLYLFFFVSLNDTLLLLHKWKNSVFTLDAVSAIVCVIVKKEVYLQNVIILKIYWGLPRTASNPVDVSKCLVVQVKTTKIVPLARKVSFNSQYNFKIITLFYLFRVGRTFGATKSKCVPWQHLDGSWFALYFHKRRSIKFSFRRHILYNKINLPVVPNHYDMTNFWYEFAW